MSKTEKIQIAAKMLDAAILAMAVDNKIYRILSEEFYNDIMSEKDIAGLLVETIVDMFYEQENVVNINDYGHMVDKMYDIIILEEGTSIAKVKKFIKHVEG